MITDFTVRRLAQMVKAGDHDGIQALLFLMFKDEYHRVSTEEMLDTLCDVDRQVERAIAER